MFRQPDGTRNVNMYFLTMVKRELYTENKS